MVRTLHNHLKAISRLGEACSWYLPQITSTLNLDSLLSAAALRPEISPWLYFVHVIVLSVLFYNVDVKELSSLTKKFTNDDELPQCCKV